jgi:sugar lactone lactonase YvrE
MAATTAFGAIDAVSEPMLVGESPMWHPDENALYWCDIAGHALHRLDPASGARACWSFPTDVACCVPAVEGGLLFDPATGERHALARPRYDPACERYDDGKADALGRFWCGTLHEPRQPANAALYCISHGRTSRMAEGATASNGLAFSPDSRTLYWADTPAHIVYAFDFDVGGNELSGRRVYAQFPQRLPDEPLERYGGCPDGAAVDSQGRYWVAMYEGARLLCLAPDGRTVRELALPVRCPTMPCFGGPDLRTLYVTSVRAGRPAAELAREPLAGCVLSMRVDVPGLPANYARWR